MKLPESELPTFPRTARHPIPAQASTRMKVLKEWRDRRAQQMGLEASLVLTNAQTESLVLANPGRRKDLDGIDALRSWQKRLFGSEICSILIDTQ